MIYAALGALLVGLSLGLFGSGGSILTVPALVYVLGHEDKAAIAESLVIVGGIALVGATQYAAAGAVAWRTAALFALPGVVGTTAGAWLSGFVPGAAQLLVFALVMATAARAMWRRATTNPSQPAPAPASNARVALQGIIVGVLTGFVGVGGGFLIVPALVLLAGLEMRRAVATSLLVIAVNAAAGFVRHHGMLERLGLGIDWPTVLVFLAVGSAASIAGKRINAGLDQRRLARGFAVFLALMAGFIVVKESIGLFAAPPRLNTEHTR